MLAVPRRVAWTAAAALAVGAGAATAHGVAPLGPRLVLHVSPVATIETYQFVELRAEPRGGETIPAVRLEVVSGDVGVRGRTVFFDLRPDNAALFDLRISRDSPEDPVVRVKQEGLVNRSYLVVLPVDRR